MMALTSKRLFLYLCISISLLRPYTLFSRSPLVNKTLSNSIWGTLTSTQNFWKKKRAKAILTFASVVCSIRGVVYRQKKGGRKRVVSPQCEVRLKMATADFAIMRLTAQPHCKICISFKRGAKNFRKRGKCTKKRATRNRLVYRDDAEGDWASRCRHRENTSRRQAKKTSTASKATLSICLMRTKVVASSPICKSSVVDLVISRDHQNDNAVWLCPFTKKVKQKRARSRAHLNRRALAPKSAVYHLGYLGIDECKRKKTSIESCRWPPQSARFSVRKRCVVCFWLNLTKSKFSLFRLSNNLCCHWCWSLCSRSYPNPSKNTKSDPKSLTRIALHRISCGSACLTQVRPSPFWGAPRTVVKPRASSPLFFGGTQHPLALLRHDPPPFDLSFWSFLTFLHHGVENRRGREASSVNILWNNSKEKLVKWATEFARLRRVSIQSCTQNRPYPKVQSLSRDWI